MAALASAMYALDVAHGSTVGWIANRNALIGASFAIAALLCQHQRVRGRSRAFALGAWLCYATSLLASELALGIAGYLLAYAVFLDQRRIRSRLLGMLPYALITLIWAIARSAGGYGAYRMYTYTDPLREPGEFLHTLPERMLTLLASQSVRLTADVSELLPAATRGWFTLTACLACALTLWFVWPSLRASRATRFFGFGAVLSALPLTATMPGDRLLTLVGFGVLPVLAYAMYSALQPTIHASAMPATPLRARWAAVAGFLHLVISPACLPATALLPALMDHAFRELEADLPDDPSVRDKTVIVTAVPESAAMSYLPVMRSERALSVPKRQYWFVSTHQPVRLERRADNVMRVTPERGFYDDRSEARSPEEPLHAGDRIELSDMTVQIVALTADGRPAVCDFIFHESLDSSKYVWRTWRKGHFENWAVLAVGEQTVVTMS